MPVFFLFLFFLFLDTKYLRDTFPFILTFTFNDLQKVGYFFHERKDCNQISINIYVEV